MARLRACLGDLATAMEAEVTPESALAEARNVIRNRVEPALGELEDVLKQSGLTFFWKSVLGATALTFSATATPGSTIQGGARLIAQTMEYRFSKTAMVRKHPFGYLHQVGEEFGHSPRHSVTRVAETLQDPRGTLRDLLQGLLLARLERRGEQRDGGAD